MWDNACMFKLSYQEIKERMIEWRNLKKLHANAREMVAAQSELIKTQREQLETYKQLTKNQDKIIEDLKLQIEELRTMIFGKKRKKTDIEDNDPPDHSNSPKNTVPRSTASYQRPIPRDEEVTETKTHPIDYCLCGSELTKKQTVVFYEEDVPIPARKIIRKHQVEKGYCPKCKKQQSAASLPNHKVVLGENVQKYACYLSIMCRLSFTQIQNILQDAYQIHISQGEIAKILDREAIHLRPFYERLKEQIRGEPIVHLDETGWRLFIDKDKSYAWVMSGAQSQESVFLVGESRGKGNADRLLGENFNGLAVTDDYVAYRKLKRHQLCWAHLIRKFRDLAESKELKDNQRKYCQEEYVKLCLIYDDLKQNRDPQRYGEFSKRLATLAGTRSNDPIKMIRIKTTLEKNISRYLTCLENPEIPLTNNQAERSLRHLVLKRKISFGSSTKKTANNLAVLLSALMSLKQRYQADFFSEYLRV